MNGDWLLLTKAALATLATNFSLAVVKSLCGTINALTRPLQHLSQPVSTAILFSIAQTESFVMEKHMEISVESNKYSKSSSCPSISD